MTSTATGRRIKGLDADERRAERRRKLLDAALDLFASRGYADTAIEQVCQHATVSTKGFYELFDGKEACFLALLDDVTARVSERVTAALLDASAGNAVRAGCAAFAHAIADDPRVARAVYAQAGGISPDIERRRRQNRLAVAAFLEGVWRADEAIADPPGGLRPVAVGVVGGLLDIVTDWLATAPGPGTPADVDLLIDRLATFYDITHAGLTGS